MQIYSIKAYYNEVIFVLLCLSVLFRGINPRHVEARLPKFDGQIYNTVKGVIFQFLLIQHFDKSSGHLIAKKFAYIQYRSVF